MTNVKSSVVPGVVGAVVGAGVAVVATKVLADKKARQAVMDGAARLKDHVIDSVNEAKKTYEIKGGMAKAKAKKAKAIGKAVAS